MEPRNAEERDFLSGLDAIMADLETLRQGNLVEMGKRWPRGLISGVALSAIGGLIVMKFPSESSFKLVGIGLIALWGAIYAWITAPEREYQNRYKEMIIPKIVKLLGLRFYNAHGGVPIRDVTTTRIVPAHDRYNSEDYFEGAYKGAEIRLCQVDLEKKRRTGKSTYYDTIFKGLFLLLTLPKDKFYGHTILIKDQNFIMEWFKESFSGMKRADLVDPAFEKKYDVYTTDQVEARYLFHPAMVERIAAIESVYSSQGISISCDEKNRVFVLIKSSRDFFAPPPLKKPQQQMSFAIGMKRELEAVLQLIDYLDMYEPAERSDVTTGST